MADKRAGGIFLTSFVGGVLVTAAIFAPRAWDPVPEPFFGLEEKPEVAAPLPEPTATTKPAEATERDLETMAIAMRERAQAVVRPERLAMNGAAPDITAAVTGQSIPEQQRQATAGPVTVAPERIAATPPDSLKSLVTRVQMRRSTGDAAAAPARIEPLPEVDSLGLAPLPGEAWTDPDRVNWSDAPTRHGQPRPRSLTAPRQADEPGGRLLERIRGRGRRDEDRGAADRMAMSSTAAAPPDRGDANAWPEPAALIAQLDPIASNAAATDATLAAAREWASATLDTLRAIAATGGPRDAAAAGPLLSLGDAVHEGMSVADAIAEQTASSAARRAALAVSRRVAVWRAAAAWLNDHSTAGSRSMPVASDPLTTARVHADVSRLLMALERFEATLDALDAAAAKECFRVIAGASGGGGEPLCRAVTDHYLAPNVRIAVHQQLLEKFLPEAQVKTGPVDEIIAGRPVRGTRTVTRTTTVKFIPDVDEIAFHLEVHGDIASRSVTDAGPVSLTSRGNSSFVVQKPVKLSPQGLLFGPATGVASNRSHLDGIQTSFDSVPVMRSLVRQIAKSQHDDSMPDVNREVIDKIVATACRETDAQAEPQFAEIAERIRLKLWEPLVKLGLQPTPVALETTPSMATIRLRLAADSQLAAHTPRPRAPTDACLSMQVHDSSFNNAFERLDIAGRTLALEDLVTQLCTRLGLEPKIPDDLPEGVQVTFARTQPLRVECRDGLVHVRVAIEALESGRRSWYDLVAHVAYRPTVSGPQVFLEREGPVQISGPGHQGRMEIGLRTIFGKIFPKERPIAVLPERIVANPKMQTIHAVQAVSSDGWFGLALASREPAATVAAPKPTAPEARRPAIFR